MGKYSSIIKKWRESCGYTQAEIAKKIKISEHNFNRWENENIDVTPRLSNLRRFAEFLGIPFQEFLAGPKENKKMDPSELNQIMQVVQKNMNLDYWLAKFGKYADGILEENVEKGILVLSDEKTLQIQPGESIQSTPAHVYRVMGSLSPECQAAMDILWKIHIIRDTIAKSTDRVSAQNAALHGLFLGLEWMNLQE